jgi:hypothetical protein
VTRPLVLAGVAAAAVIALLVACPPQNLPKPVPPAPAPQPGFEPPGDGSGAGSGSPVAGGVAGASCNTGADCASGVCEGEGCGAGQGVCAAEKRACTLDLRPYCGCDGVTFDASSTCPRRRFSQRGACAASSPGADGSPCLQASDCASGICEGQGCADDAPGKCASKARGCTRDRRPYCGCDGATFYGSGTCPGKRYSAAAECPAK